MLCCLVPLRATLHHIPLQLVDILNGYVRVWIKELNNGVRAVSAVFSCIMFTTIRYHIGPGQIHHHAINHETKNTSLITS